LPKSKWKRSVKTDADIHQALLTANGCKPKQSLVKQTDVHWADVNAKHFCPFCLYIGKLKEFLISTKKGISQKKAKCPECKNGMMMRTLVASWTPEEYAEFAYPYSASGFWQKVPFDLWKKRLHKLRWSYQFWKRYKELKGSGEDEGYEATMERQQEEWAKEEGLIQT